MKSEREMQKDMDAKITAKLAGNRVWGRRTLTAKEWQRFNEVRAAENEGKTTPAEMAQDAAVEKAVPELLHPEPEIDEEFEL
jgi:hypothetical protein